MPNFGPTNPHGIAFAPKQWLYQKEPTVWRAQKCITLVGADTVLTFADRKVPCFIGGSIGPRMEICGTSGLSILMVARFHQSNGYMKRKLRP